MELYLYRVVVAAKKDRKAQFDSDGDVVCLLFVLFSVCQFTLDTYPFSIQTVFFCSGICHIGFP